MKLISETVEDVRVNIIEEGAGKGKGYFIEGPFIMTEEPNKNKRIYRKDPMRKEVQRYMKEAVQTNRAMGELEHPQTPKINLDRVSHMITDLKEDGNVFMGKAKVLDTPCGKIVKALLDEGAKFGVSTRGLGTVRLNSEGINEVQDDFRLATAADIVADPSAPTAFVNGIMEDVDWVRNDKGEWIAEQARREIERSVRSRTFNEEAQLDVFRRFMNRLVKIQD